MPVEYVIHGNDMLRHDFSVRLSRHSRDPLRPASDPTPAQNPHGQSRTAAVPIRAADQIKSWAAEYGPAGVRVNAVSPGPTRTEGTAELADVLDQLVAAAPAGRPGLPEEIAAAIAYLASDEASFVQGALLPVDGGRTAV
jgi:NAD(P)-dependent dehydrogenase (short-subunit alcohol dehydrogenase family)